MTGKDIAGIALVLFVLSGASGLGYAKYSLSRQAFDKTTLCPTREHGGVRAATVILIDKTDPFSKSQTDAIRQRISTARSELAIGAKIEIVVLEKAPDRDETQIRIVAGLCNPGSGDTANPIYQNARSIQRRYDGRFAEPLDRDLQGLLEPGIAPESPVVLAVGQAISQDADIAAVEGGRLIVISDLLEHTKDASVYRQTFGIDKIRRGIPDSVKTWLSQASVSLDIVQRTKDPDRKPQAAAREAWVNYLKEIGVHGLSVGEL